MEKSDSTQRAIETRPERCLTSHAPIAATRYCVVYLKQRKEYRTAWLYRHDHAQRALEIVQRRYGEKNAIIYVD